MSTPPSIIEYLEVHYPGAVALIPADRNSAIEVGMLDRFFDNYVMTPMQKIVGDAMRSENEHDPRGVEEARAMLDRAYAFLDKKMTTRAWVAGNTFGLADCAAAPALFYADWSHPLGDRFPNVTAYRESLLARPSFARAVDEARLFRPLFPSARPTATDGLPGRKQALLRSA